MRVASVNGKIEDTNVENSAGDPSDVHSQSLLVEDGNNILKQQSDSLVVGLPDCSIDTNGQTASVNGKIKDTDVENSAGDPSDVHSQSLLVEDGNNILKQLSDSLVVGLPDCSIDTNGQTDSVEANWGSVSDVSDVQGTNTPVSMEAAQGTDLQKISTDRFEPPYITSLVKSGNEEDLKSASPEIQTLTTQGETKKEDSGAKLSLDSGKTHSTSLRSLLGSIVEKKVKTKQNDDGSSPKTVNSTTTESTMKTNQQKEWDSPARLPVTMGTIHRFCSSQD